MGVNGKPRMRHVKCALAREEMWFATRFCALQSPVKNHFSRKANVVLYVTT